MKYYSLLCLLLLSASRIQAADPGTPAKPVLKITPGQVIVPTDAMRRIWGELVSMDLNTRTGTFRKEGTDEIMPFKVLPYAELLHHAAVGDLQDFRIGVRAIFRMHEAEDGQWTWLTYIQDQMNMMNGHKEYFHVDGIDAGEGKLTVTQGSLDKSYIREKDIVISTDGETKFWKNAQPATFADIKVGDTLRTETHGVGAGKVQMCWNVFLDDTSLAKFQNEQKALHSERLKNEGLPGYVDSSNKMDLEMTLFRESSDFATKLTPGRKVQAAPAGIDRRPSAPPIGGTVISAKMQGTLCKVKITLDGDTSGFVVGGVARLWPQP